MECQELGCLCGLVVNCRARNTSERSFYAALAGPASFLREEQIWSPMLVGEGSNDEELPHSTTEVLGTPLGYGITVPIWSLK